MLVSVTDAAVQPKLDSLLSELDSKHIGARQVYKLSRLQLEMSAAFAAAVNTSSTGSSSDPVSGAFYLLSISTPIHVGLVFDTLEGSVQLVWSTLNFKALMHARGQNRYLFYLMATLVDRPLFLHTQNLCARWWRFTRTFANDPQGLLRACNALEAMLYRDPNIPTYKID